MSAVDVLVRCRLRVHLSTKYVLVVSAKIDIFGLQALFQLLNFGQFLSELSFQLLPMGELGVWQMHFEQSSQ